MKEFAGVCQSYGITHQFTTPIWPQCNGMVECLIKTIKQGLMVIYGSHIYTKLKFIFTTHTLWVLVWHLG